MLSLLLTLLCFDCFLNFLYDFLIFTYNHLEHKEISRWCSVTFCYRPEDWGPERFRWLNVSLKMTDELCSGSQHWLYYTSNDILLHSTTCAKDFVPSSPKDIFFLKIWVHFLLNKMAYCDRNFPSCQSCLIIFPHVSVMSNHSHVVKDIKLLLLVIKLLLFHYCHYNRWVCGTNMVCVVYSVEGDEIKCWVIFGISHLNEVHHYFDPHWIIQHGWSIKWVSDKSQFSWPGKLTSLMKYFEVTSGSP